MFFVTRAMNGGYLEYLFAPVSSHKPRKCLYRNEIQLQSISTQSSIMEFRQSDHALTCADPHTTKLHILFRRKAA